MTSVEKNCIYFLDNDPKIAAQVLFDTDLKSSILYLAIVVSACLRQNLPDFDWKKEGYTIYHADMEPPFEQDVRWLESTAPVWTWAKEYFKAMCIEHEYRFDYKHPSSTLIDLFELCDIEPETKEKEFFVPPPVTAVPHKYHCDSNFRNQKMFNDKKSKGKWKLNVLNTYRAMYKYLFDQDISPVAVYTKRSVPTFIRPAATARAGGVNAPRSRSFTTGRF